MGTVAVKLQLVVKNLETLLAGDAGLQRFDAPALEFNDPPAAQADQVIVVLPLGPALETGGPLSKPATGGQPVFGQQFKRAVDRGVADSRVVPANPLVQIFHGKMGSRLEEDPHDLVPLAGGLQSPAP